MGSTGRTLYAYYAYAVGPLRDSLAHGQAPPPTFWPLGFPTFVALTSLVVGRSPLAGQIVALVSAALVVFFTWLLARDLGQVREGGATAFWSALAVASTAQLWVLGIVVMSDTLAVAAATASAWALVRYRATRRAPWLVLTASALAWATATRWLYAVLVPVWLLALVFPALCDRGGGRSGSGAVLFATVYLGVLAPQVWMTSRGTGRPGPVSYAEFGWSPVNFFLTTVDTPDGRLVRRYPNALFYAALPAHRMYLTPLVALFVPIGIVHALRHRRWLTLILGVAWPVVIYALVAGAPVQNSRFILACLPPLALLAGLGVQATVSAYPRWRRVAMAAFVAGLILMALTGVSWCRATIAQKHADLATSRWVDDHTSRDAVVLAFSLTLTLQHYGARDTRELFIQSIRDLEALTAQGRPFFLLVDVDTMYAQWRDRAPGQNFRWLQTHTDMTAVGRHATYTLFEVKPR